MPDKQHSQYYKDNPNGNHPMPSPETLRFMQKQEKTNEKIMDGLMSIKAHLAKHDEKLDAIHLQTTRTNGRVTTLEGSDKEQEKRLNKFTGALILGNLIVVPIIVGIVVRFLTN